MTTSNTTSTDEKSEIAFAETEEELRYVFARSQYADIAPALSFANYFPRSRSRALGENRMVDVAGNFAIAFVGVLAAVIIYFIVRHSAQPLIICLIMGLPTIALLKKLMPRLYAQTSEASKFVELICFDDRRPVIYLRRFRSEDPPLATILKRHIAVRSLFGIGDEDQPLESLSELLNTCGSVVAIGRPADRAIHHRIYRLYVDDGHWRDTVGSLLKKAKAVFLHYETSYFLDWELREALALVDTPQFILITSVPKEAALDAKRALDFLPVPIKELGRQFEYIRKGRDSLASEEYALLAVISKDVSRLYGVKMHWNDLLWTLFREIVHNLHLTEDRRFTSLPPAYEGFARKLSGQQNAWAALLISAAFFSIGLICGLAILFKWY